MPEVWFTADHHFGHANIIKHCNRPFSSVEEMNETLIARWNERVQRNDIVYHLGDFAFKDHQRYLNNLKGQKVLVVGNHDPKEIQRLHHSTKFDWNSIHRQLEITIGSTYIVLCHYAMRVWNRAHHGALHFYGHSHGNLAGDSQSCDVGVDCFNFYPVNLEQIQARLKDQRPRDNHMSKKSELFDLTAKVKVETEKGLLLDDGTTEAWVPKSQVEDNKDGTFTMPAWLAKDKGFV